MDNLVVASVLLGLISAMCFTLGLWVGRLHRKWITDGVTAIVVIACILFHVYMMDQPVMVWLAPVASAVVLAQWLVPMTAALAGIIAGRRSIPWWRRSVMGMILIGAGLYGSFRYYIGPAPHCVDWWNGDVCRQSSDYTCGPAAAATLLKSAALDVTECDMVDACLTTQSGTTFLGLYRGLKLQTPRVRLYTGDVAGLRRLNRPVLMVLRLPSDTSHIDPRYFTQWGWGPGVSHTVVLFEFNSANTILVGEPAVGREQWSVKSLNVLWTGQGFYLE